MALKNCTVKFLGSYDTPEEAWGTVETLTRTMLPAAMNKLRQLPEAVPVLSLRVREVDRAWWVEMVKR